MSESSFLFVFFLIAFFVLLIEIAQWISQELDIPQVIGELLAGLILGPSLLNIVDLTGQSPSIFEILNFATQDDVNLANDIILFLAEVAALLLLFEVGLKIDVKLLQRVKNEALTTAIGGTIIPFSFGLAFAFLFRDLFTIPGIPFIDVALFLGTALAATSIGISVRVLIELGRLDTKSTRILIGAAIIDDILALFIFALISEYVSAEQTTTPVFLIIVQIAFFFIISILMVIIFRKYLAPHLNLHPDKYRILSVSLVMIFGFSWLAGTLNLTPIIGALVAGVIIGRDSELESETDELTKPINRWLIPFFFIAVGLRVDLQTVTKISTFFIALLLSIIAVLSKVIGAGSGAFIYGQSRMESLEIGFGMAPRGEVILLIATSALEIGIFNDILYAMIIMTVTVSALISPFALKYLLQHQQIDST